MIQKKGYKCEICSLSMWMDKLISLALDHIDGNASNNYPINLRMICFNCHGQTESYAGKIEEKEENR